MRCHDCATHFIGADDGARELAALALGPSTRPEALETLLAHLQAGPARERTGTPTLRALGLQRNDRRTRRSARGRGDRSDRTSEAAVAGLAARRFEAGVRERTHAAARENPAAERLKPALARAFPVEPDRHAERVTPPQRHE